MAILTKTDLLNLKLEGKPISMLSLYDYSLAKAAESAGIDAILVGDSVGMVSLGMSSTVPVSINEMRIFCSAANRGAPNTFLIGDLPFGSYETNVDEAIKSSITLIKSGVNAVKLEGGKRVAPQISGIANANIPIMGHLGVTPQTVTNEIGYKAFGRSEKQLQALKEDMKAVEEAGAFSILLEGVIREISQIAKNWVAIPVYSIGSGSQLDGQLLLAYDVLGLYPHFKPKFAKNFLDEVLRSNLTSFDKSHNMFDLATAAFKLYNDQVKSSTFPTLEFSYNLKESDKYLIQIAESI